ncbi:PAM68 family protein [Vulcanococcus limneticus Candia 3F8]|nr:PAM68 family protein [Vulcanococcus limneticus MW73D5]MCP9893188.1 PAM68 family protein [Vulcanococcus limneticus Candia 3F8]MCP9896909.1 PAM68 family protein [Vulcanococcus limneticus Candia 3B3]
MAGKGKGKAGSGIRPSKAGGSPAAGRSSGAQAAGNQGAGGSKPSTGRMPSAGSPGRGVSQGIPTAVSNRMARRITIATGIPSVLGMGVFIASYLLVSRSILDIPPGITLVASGGCFLLGLLGLSYGVLSSSWEDAPGSLLGLEQIGLNVGRLRSSFKRPPASS